MATAIFIAFYVNHRHFNTTSYKAKVIEPDGTTSDHGFMIQQSDISTIVSALQTLLRAVGDIWTGVTVWRCMFVLLKTGITLSDFQSTISLRFPTWCLPIFYGHSSIYKHFTANSKLGKLVAITLTIILTFPSRLSSPILTGSINWIPSNYTLRGTQQVKQVSNTAPGTEAWYWYRKAPHLMAPIIVDIAAATAIDIWGRNLPRSSSQVMRRYLYTTSNLTVGSQLENVTVPFFSIDSLRWLPTPEIESIQFQSKKLGSYSLDPFLTSERPWVALIPPKDWKPSQDRGFPKANVKEESGILAVLVDPSHPNVGNNSRHCQDLRSTLYFGDIPPDIGLKRRTGGTCYAFAAVGYRAGAAKCVNCRIFTTGVVESGDISTLTLQNDPMTSEALVLLPKVSQSMISGNSSVPLPYAPWPLESNITYYATEVLSRAYQSIWGALTEEFHADNVSLSTNVHIVVNDSVQAQVTFWRVWLWLGLNVMLTLSGLLWFLYGSSELGMVFDAESTALLLDPTSISGYDDHHLSMSKGHISREVGPLRLKWGVPSSPLQPRSPEMEKRWFLESVDYESRHTSPGVYERIDMQTEEDTGMGRGARSS